MKLEKDRLWGVVLFQDKEVVLYPKSNVEPV